jgi:transposase-like protein
MHRSVRKRKISGTGGHDKAKVIGMIERGGKVRVRHVPELNSEHVHGFIREGAEPGSSVYTDRHHSYSGLDADYAHETVDHAERYVQGQVHTNCMENFWSLLKRGLHGTYISVKPYHLFRYLDERAFTFNERDLTDLGRFTAVLGSISGRRLTWDALTGRT